MTLVQNDRSSQVACDGAAADAYLDNLLEFPFKIAAPSEHLRPFVFASPHSGRLYPSSFLRLSRLSAVNLRRSEDAYVDELVAGVVALGAPLISARFPRAYVDANRAPAELDPAMFSGALCLAVDRSSSRVTAGLGVIPRLVRDNAEIYRAKLAPAEAHNRIAGFHQPYHTALGRLISETFSRFAAVVVVDCHSMPSAASAPDIVLGDRYGTAASHGLVCFAEHAFQRNGFTVARNVPYAGGYTTGLYGDPTRGIHALQVEVNRMLYLDEERIVPNARFGNIACRLASAIAEIMSIDATLLRARQDMSLAAE